MSKCLFEYNEYGPGMGFPSMKDNMNSKPYFGMEKIIAYLKNGKKTYAAAGRAKDFFSGDYIPGEYCGMTDGEYSWISSLVYYVEKYNLRLNKDFERKVLGQ